MDRIKEMIEIAISNLDKAYAPYSNYKVSAVIEMSSGKLYTGVNVENAVLSVGTCAERTALFHAIAEGEKVVRTAVIVGGPDGHIEDYCVPCGTCRQALREFCNPKEMTVICAKSTEDYISMTLDELLPHSFGSEYL